MEPAEVEFLAEKELITVVPNFSENKLYLISGEVGPFNPSMQTKVPLWLAINLRQRQKCHIVPPDWLNVEYLTEKKKEEEAADLVFTAMPSRYYMEVSSLILNNSAEDVPKADEVRTLVKDIWDMRQAKLKKGVDQMISQQETFGKLDNLTQMELNCIRPFLTAALDHLHLLHYHAASYTSSSQTD